MGALLLRYLDLGDEERRAIEALAAAGVEKPERHRGGSDTRPARTWRPAQTKGPAAL